MKYTPYQVKGQLTRFLKEKGMFMSNTEINEKITDVLDMCEGFKMGCSGVLITKQR